MDVITHNIQDSMMYVFSDDIVIVGESREFNIKLEQLLVVLKAKDYIKTVQKLSIFGLILAEKIIRMM